MGRLNYETTSGPKHEALRELEQFLDNEIEKIPFFLHEELLQIYERTNDLIGEAVDEYVSRIKELEDDLEELR